jgi:hypothetical protein
MKKRIGITLLITSVFFLAFGFGTTYFPWDYISCAIGGYMLGAGVVFTFYKSI